MRVLPILMSALLFPGACSSDSSGSGPDSDTLEDTDSDSETGSDSDTDTELNGPAYLHDLGGLVSIWGRDQQNIFVGGWNGNLFQYDGETWTQALVPSTGLITDISGNSTADVWASSDDHFEYEVLMLHFDGVDWNAVEPPEICHDVFPAVYATNASSVYAVFNCGILIGPTPPSVGHFNGVDQWLNDIDGLSLYDTDGWDIHGIWAPNDDHLVGAGAVLVELSQGEWSDELHVPYKEFRGVHGDDEGTVFAVGDYGMIAKKETDGWVLAVSTPSNHLRNVWVNGPDDA